MSRVFSKFLDETEKKLGIPAVTITRGLYSAAFLGYFVKVLHLGLANFNVN